MVGVRPFGIGLLLALIPSAPCAWSPHALLPHRRVSPHMLAPVALDEAHDVPAAGADTEATASELLAILDVWLRGQSVSSVLSRRQASSLLEELRSDRRFWAQQRRQFARVWTAIEEGLGQETRPLEEVLGPDTSARLIDALEQMDEQPGAVNAVIRSEVMEKLLGHVLYEGIFEFVQRADLLGNMVNNLPVVGPLRVQFMKAARAQFTLVLGEQLSAFLGEYSSSAAEQAAGYVLNESNRPTFRAARRKLGSKLLATPINELVGLNKLEMAILRDTVWSAVQEFRLPNEESLLDALYLEFGDEPFAILLPTTSQAERGVRIRHRDRMRARNGGTSRGRAAMASA